MPTPTISTDQFINMFIRAEALLREKKQDLNSINTFPIADGDTGSNMLLTFSSIKYELENYDKIDLKGVANLIAETAFKDSKGSSGILLAQYLNGFCKDINGEHLTPKDLVTCIKNAAKFAKKSFIKTKKGSALETIQATTIGIDKLNSPSKIIEKSLAQAQKALEKTQLNSAGVVDAGGAGILVIFTGFLASLKNEDIIITTNFRRQSISYLENTSLKFKYGLEVVFEVTNPDYKELDLTKKLKALGNSIQIASNKSLKKLIIHSNQPANVNETISEIGHIESFKVEDLQHIQSEHISSLHTNQNSKNTEKNSILERYHTLLITDSSIDIPPYFINRYPVKVLQLPIYNLFDDTKVKESDLKSSNFYSRMEDDANFRPKAYKISVNDFQNAFSEGLKTATKVICLPVSQGISKTYESAIAARMMLEGDERIKVIDTQTTSAGLYILLNHIFAAIEKDFNWSKIQNQLEKLKTQIQAYFVVDDIKYMERAELVNFNNEGIAKIFNVQPLLKLKSGKIELDQDKIYFANPAKKINSLFKKIKMYNQIKPVSELVVVYAGGRACEEATKLVKKIENELKIPGVSTNLLPLDIVMGCQLGPGTIGTVFI
ncbi:MAG: DegV family protein [Patescibacteria group bacterium]